MKLFYLFLTLAGCISVSKAAPQKPILLADISIMQKIEGAQPEIKVSLNNHPAMLSVDTGANFHILIPEFLKFPKGQMFKNIDGWGVPTTEHSLPELNLQIGGWSSKQDGFATEAMPPFSVDEPGILSPQRLRGVGLYVINFPGQRMQFFDVAPESLESWAIENYPGFTFEKLSIVKSLGADDLEAGVTNVEASLNELAPKIMLIDTGGRFSNFSDNYLRVNSPQVVKSGRSGSGAEINERVARNHVLHLGQHSVFLKKTYVAPAKVDKGRAGVIGMDVLKGLILIVDFPNGNLLLGFPARI